MTEVLSGGKKAAIANLKRNPNHYREIGKIGGSRGTTGGFNSIKIGADGLTGRQRAIIAGRKGGLKSKRGQKKLTSANRCQ